MKDVLNLGTTGNIELSMILNPGWGLGGMVEEGGKAL